MNSFKINKSLLLLILSLTLISACGILNKNTNKNPVWVAEKFLYHFNRLEFEEAKAYGTSQTETMLDFLLMAIEMSEEAVKREEVEFKMLRLEKNGNQAFYYYTTNGKEEKLELLKQDGKWLVNLTKEDKKREN